jgi:hypothetical protein
MSENYPYPPQSTDEEMTSDAITHANVSLLDATSLQRTLSNYAGMIVSFMLGFSNLLVVMFTPQVRYQYVVVVAVVMILLVGCFVTFYWMSEQREMMILHEVRFRSLMETERRYTREGLLSREWEHIGDYPYRRSPILYIRSARILPAVFLGFQLIPLYLLFVRQFLEK